jgi:hypothetical protein
MSQLASARGDSDSGSAPLSKILLTLCFFSGYPFLPHVNEAADFLRGEPVLMRARPEEVHPTRGDRCARVAANTVLLVAQLGSVLAVREVKQRDPKDKA